MIFFFASRCFIQPSLNIFEIFLSQNISDEVSLCSISFHHDESGKKTSQYDEIIQLSFIYPSFDSGSLFLHYE